MKKTNNHKVGGTNTAASLLAIIEQADRQYSNKTSDNLTIEELIAALPILKINGKTKHVSQSMLKRWKGTTCNRKFYEETILRSCISESSQSQNEGTRFEYLLTGQVGVYDGAGAKPFVTSRGKESAAEMRVQANAELAKKTLSAMGFDLEEGVPGVHVQVAGLSGTKDLVYASANVDIKYSGLLVRDESNRAKWNDFAWYVADDPDHPNHIVNSNAMVQAVHYTLLDILEGKERKPFVFFVFDNRTGHEGECLPIWVDISDHAIKEHLIKLTDFINELQQLVDSGELLATSPEKLRCEACPFKEECEDREEQFKFYHFLK